MKKKTILNLFSILCVVNILNIYSNNDNVTKSLTNKKAESTIVVESNNLNSLPKNKVIPLVNDGTNFSKVVVSSSRKKVLVKYYDEFNNKENVVNTTTSDYTETNSDSELTITSPIQIPAGSYAGARLETTSTLLTLYFPEIGGLKIKHLIIVTYENTKTTLAKKRTKKQL